MGLREEEQAGTRKPEEGEPPEVLMKVLKAANPVLGHNDLLEDRPKEVHCMATLRERSEAQRYCVLLQEVFRLPEHQVHGLKVVGRLEYRLNNSHQLAEMSFGGAEQGLSEVVEPVCWI